MIRVALTACQRSPDLLDCDPVSVLGCVMQAAQLGLETDGILGHAYLVPFNNTRARRKECQLIVGYKGYLALARRSGEVSSFFAHVVYKGDRFTFQYGTQADLIHVPNMDKRGEPVAVYAVVKLRDGGADFEVLPWSVVLECQQKYGRGRGPWHDHLEEMARKTAIRRLAKRCPVSVEIQRAASMDELAEIGEPQELTADLGLSPTDQLAARLGAAEHVAGEIVDAEFQVEREERAAIEGEAGGQS